MEKHYTTGDLAKLFHVSPTTIFRAILKKKLKAATTPGGHFRVAKTEADDFLKKNNVVPPLEKRAAKAILIVEDNPVESRLFVRALEKDPALKVKATASGYEAGFLTQSFKPDVILLDIFLPDIDGREVARLIYADPQLRHIKIVAITGTKDPIQLEEIKAFKFHHVLKKPIDPEKLRDYLKDLVG